MKCPACERDLKEKKVGDLAVDICEGGCGGIWFDAFELKKVDEKHETAGEELLNIERDPNLTVDLEKKRKCPRCETIVMMQHYFSVKNKVVVDECGGCGGFWLDAGELSQIRSLFETEADRKKAVSGYLQEVFKEDLVTLKEEAAEKETKAGKIRSIFGFMCPPNSLKKEGE